MDLPVGVLNALIIVSQIDPLVLTKFVAMPPIKITQATASHLFFPKVNHTGEDRLISKPIVGNNKLSMAFTASLLNVTDIALADSKAVKSDDALIDESMWNLSDLMPVSGRDPYLFPYISK